MATPDRMYGAKKRHDLEVALYARFMSRVAVAKSHGDTVEKTPAAVPAIMAGARALAPKIAGALGIETAGAATGAATGAGAGATTGTKFLQGAQKLIGGKSKGDMAHQTLQRVQDQKAQAEQTRQNQVDSAKEAATKHANTQKGHKIAFDYTWNVLKSLPGAQTTLPSFDEDAVKDAVEGDKKKVYISSKPGSEDIDLEEQQTRHNNLLEDLKNLGGGTQIFSGKGHSPWGEEYSLMVDNIQDDDMALIQQLASHYGQEAIAVTGDEEGPRFETPGGEITDRFSSEGLANSDESPDFFTQFATGQKSVLS